MQPRTWFAFVAAAWLMFILLSTRTPGLSQKGCSQPHRSQPALGFLVISSQVQDLALAFVRLHTVLAGPLFLLVSVSDKGLSFWQVHLTIQFGIISKLGECVFDPSIQIIYEDVYQPGAQYWSLRDPAGNRLPAWVKSIDHHLWVQPVRHFATHLTDHTSNPYLASLPRRNLWETVSNALLKSRQTSSNAPPHPPHWQNMLCCCRRCSS